MRTGRPSLYNQEVALTICEQTATTSKSLKTICQELDIAPRTVLGWLADESKTDFLHMYTRAKEEQADFLAEEMIEIADDGKNDTIQTDKGAMEDKEWTSRSKLRVETRKWIASKLKPRKYGEKLDVTSGDKVLSGFQIVIDGNSPDKDNEPE